MKSNLSVAAERNTLVALEYNSLTAGGCSITDSRGISLADNRGRNKVHSIDPNVTRSRRKDPDVAASRCEPIDLDPHPSRQVPNLYIIHVENH